MANPALRRFANTDSDARRVGNRPRIDRVAKRHHESRALFWKQRDKSATSVADATMSVAYTTIDHCDDGSA
jgi:hypothetical protein